MEQRISIIPTVVEEELKKSYLDYAMSVIVGRALPDVRDGLKPVHRRILFGMYELGNFHNKAFKKSARVVGECFVKNTLILTDKGLIPIQKVKTGDLLYTHSNLRKVKELYEMPSRRLLKINLDNGLNNTVTESQKFKILNNDLEYKWKEAKDLISGDHICARAFYPEIKKYVEFGNNSGNKKLNKKINKKLNKKLNEEVAYMLGQLISDGWVEHSDNRFRCGFSSSSLPIIQRIQRSFAQNFGVFAEIHKREYPFESANGQFLISVMYNLRISRSEINNLIVSAFSLENARAETKVIPEQIFISPKSVILSFLSGLIDGDGSLHKNRNVINYSSVSEKLIDQLSLLLFHMGIMSRKYIQKSEDPMIMGRKVIDKKPSYFLEIRGVYAKKLAILLNLEQEHKAIRSEEIMDKKSSTSNFDRIPFSSSVIFSELGQKHIGGGWYEDLNNKKFRLGIKYKTGAKIRYHKFLLQSSLGRSQIVEWNILEKLKRIGSPYYERLKNIIENNVYFFKVESIEESNPEKTYDIQVEEDHEFIANGMISHNCMGKFHPHGDAAVYDSIVRMAQDFSLRYVLIEGQGNFGCFTKDTKVALADGRNLSFDDLMKEDKEGKKNYTYTINNGNVKIALIKSPRLTKKNQPLLKVVLDDNQEIKCTYDHKFMLRDGSYCEARDLKKGSSLMPLYQRLSSEEEMVIKTPYNHKVKEIIHLDVSEDVYDLTIEGTHNFSLSAGVFVHNSVDGDNAAAQRYTEIRLKKIAEEILQDIDKETVNFTPNFDGTLKEPTVMPCKFPNLLVNGSSGIAVGMATNMPPHNISEVCTAVAYLIDNPDSTPKQLLKFIEGPDFPTGALIYGRSGIHDYFSTGRGKVVIRSKTKSETIRNREAIIVTEIPYMVNKAMMLEEIAELVKDKKIQGISDLRDESSKDGIRVVIELKQGANSELLLNQLYKHSRMQTTFGIIMLALVDNEPRVLNMKEMIEQFILHRRIIVRRRTEYDLKKAEERAHILEGLLVALKNIDAVVQKIKQSKDAVVASIMLIKDYSLTEIQAKSVLEMRLQRLAALEQEKIKDEHSELLRKITDFKSILADEKKVFGIIKTEISELKNNYGDARRTKIVDAELEVEDEDLIKREKVVVTISHSGYAKRMPLDTYKQQRRGGRGILGAETKEEDFVEHLFVGSTHDYILLFSNIGKVYWLKVYEIPEMSRQSLGRPLVNLVELEKLEKIEAMVPVSDFADDKFLFFATKKGVVKRVELSEFANPRKSGIIALSLDEGDNILNVKLTDGSKNIILATKKGMAVRFNERNVRAMGRGARGVRGCTLRSDDEVIGMEACSENETLLTLAENGYGKRSLVSDYRLTSRGGKGVINIKVSERNGDVVSIKPVIDTDELILSSRNGIIIRVLAHDISVFGRNAQGVRIMKLSSDDKLVAAAKVALEEYTGSDGSDSENASSASNGRINSSNDHSENKSNDEQLER